MKCGCCSTVGATSHKELGGRRDTDNSSSSRQQSETNEDISYKAGIAPLFWRCSSLEFLQHPIMYPRRSDGTHGHTQHTHAEASLVPATKGKSLKRGCCCNVAALMCELFYAAEHRKPAVAFFVWVFIVLLGSGTAEIDPMTSCPFARL